MIMSEHVLFVHSPRASGGITAVLATYILLGTRLEEARADIVFGSRMVNAARAGHCPYRGGLNCTPHLLIASTIIVASVIDYITEGLEVRTCCGSPQDLFHRDPLHFTRDHCLPWNCTR